MRLSSEQQLALDRLGELFGGEVRCKFEIGDQLGRLREDHGLRIKWIARHFGRRPNRLSEIYKTAKAFPPEHRDPSIPFSYYENARACAKRFGSDRFPLTPSKALQEIVEKHLGQRHEAALHFKRKFHQKVGAEACRQSAILDAMAEGVINRCHHLDYRELWGRLPNGSIKILWADPPYAQYSRSEGRYGTVDSVARADCDHSSESAATAVTLDLLQRWQPKLATGGCFLLWQGAGPLRLPLLQSAEANDWEVAHEVVWDKSHPRSGNVDEPYLTRTERLWVLKRRGDALLNHDGSGRSDIIYFSSVRHRADAPDSTHAFQKPENLCQFLIGKHSYKGELIFDPFGCSGSACIAAAKMGRRFVYAESNLMNFSWGSSRIYSAMAKQLDRSA